MKTFVIRYVSLEGSIRTAEYELPDDATESDAIEACWEQNVGGSDDVHKIIDCEEK